MRENAFHAVLTGDIIKSSKLGHQDLEKVRRCVLDSVAEVKAWRDGLVRSRADFFRGDSWQILIADPGQALRVAVFLRAALRAQGMADSRIGIGIGTVSSISPTRVSLSTGEAFEASGQALDGITTQGRMAFSTGAASENMAELLSLVVQLCDALIAHWTLRQAEAVRLAVALPEPTHEAIAGRLDPAVTKQAVSKLLDGADWRALRSSIGRFAAVNWGHVVVKSSMTTSGG